MPLPFTYFKYDENKQRAHTNEGERYIVSPFACIYDDNFYYLLAYDTPQKKFCTFRIDRMDDMDVRPHGRMGREEFEKLDIVQFTKSAFSMYEGDSEKVTIRLPNSKIDAIIDRFGTDVFITKQGHTHFTTTVQVTVNQQFFGWIFGLGDDVEIVSPANVREQMMAALSSISKKYNP